MTDYCEHGCYWECEHRRVKYSSSDALFWQSFDQELAEFFAEHFAEHPVGRASVALSEEMVQRLQEQYGEEPANG